MLRPKARSGPEPGGAQAGRGPSRARAQAGPSRLSLPLSHISSPSSSDPLQPKKLRAGCLTPQLSQRSGFQLTPQIPTLQLNSASSASPLQPKKLCLGWLTPNSEQFCIWPGPQPDSGSSPAWDRAVPRPKPGLGPSRAGPKLGAAQAGRGLKPAPAGSAFHSPSSSLLAQLLHSNLKKCVWDV